MPAFVNPTKAVAALLTALLATTVGCSVRKESTTPGTPAGLRDALSYVQANDTTRSYVEYSNVSAINDLVHADRARFEALQSAGLGGLRAHAHQIASQVGIDPQGMRARIAVGPSTHGAGRWWGDYDRQQVDSWFAGKGTREDGPGRTVWRTAEDYTTDLTGPLRDVASLGSFNVAQTAPGLFLWANARDALDWVASPGRRSLARDPSIAELTTCLDDVVAAIIARGDSPGLPGSGGKPDVTYAAGVRAGSATDVTEVLCAMGHPIGSVDYITRVVRGAVSPTGELYSTLLPEARVLGADSFVQVTWRPTSTTPAGRSLDMLRNGEHEPIFGT